jgi:protein-S-isoprenylcysteine O-methyltransferase Ste14
MSIGQVQAVRKVVIGFALVIGIFLFAVTNSRYPSGGTVHEMIEWAGIVFIVICILGRTWTSLYIGGRKIEQLVMIGPYSITRNPLYFFSVIGAAGFGAQLGSIAVAITFAVLTWLVFHVVIIQEERVLADRFGAVFADYQKAVPRFFPNVKLWHDEPTLVIRPPRVLRTFVDASVFLLSVPIAEIFEWLQDSGALPVLLVLP